MTIISEPITDLAGVGDTTKVVFTVDVMRPDSSGTGIVTTKRVEVLPVAGVLTTPDLDPGPARVKLGTKTYRIVIPDSPTPIKLWPLLESTVEYTPPVVGAAQAAASAAATSATAAAASAASVAGIADTVTTGRLSATSMDNTYAPATDIAKTALASAVQTSLGNADLVQSRLLDTYVNARTEFGAVGDARTITSVSMTAGSATVTSAALFGNITVGMACAVIGAGASGGILLSTVTAKASTSSITLAHTAVGAVSGVKMQAGTDNTTALQSAINKGQPVLLPGGNYLTGTLTMPNECHVYSPGGGIIFNKWGRSGRLVLKAMTNGPLLAGDSAGTQAITIRDIQMDGAKDFQTVAAALINQPDRGSPEEAHWLIDNVLCENSKGDGLYLGINNRGTQVTRSWFYTCEGNGIHLRGSDCQIFHNFIGSNTLYGVRARAEAWDTQIIGNNMWSNKSAVSGEFLKLLWLSQNFIDSNMEAGASFIGCSGISVTSNIFSGNSQAAHGARASLELGDMIDTTVVTGNFFPRRPDGASTPLPSYCVVSTGTNGTFVDSANSWEGGLSSVNGFNNLYVDAGQRRLPAATLAAPMFSGKYYTAISANVSTTLNAEGSMRGGRIVIGRQCTITSIAVEVTTAGSAGALVRLGIYRLDPDTGAPSLVLDAGTVDGTSTGIKTITISQALRYSDNLLLVAVPQGGATTRATLRSNTGGDLYIGDSASTVTGTVFSGLKVESVTGALPSTPTLTGAGNGSVPRVMIMAS